MPVLGRGLPQVLERAYGPFDGVLEADLRDVAKVPLGPRAAEGALRGRQQDAVDGEVSLQLREKTANQGKANVTFRWRRDKVEEGGNRGMRSTMLNGRGSHAGRFEGEG